MTNRGRDAGGARVRYTSRQATRRRWRAALTSIAVALPTALTIAIATPEPVSAHEDSAYYHGGSVQEEFDDWMTDVDDGTLLSEMSIPGTHDSGADQGSDLFVKTQTLTIDEQLRAGIRFFDIRARHIGDRFAIHHGPVFLDLFFGAVVRDFEQFLDDHPGETIVMRLKEEHTPEDTTRGFHETLEWYLFDDDGPGYSDLFYGLDDTTRRFEGDEFPALGDLRGQVLLMQDFCIDGRDCGRYGINYGGNDFDIQDNFELDNLFDLYGKWEDVKDQLYDANSGERNKYYVNFLSASSIGEGPYFWASGHIGTGTSSSRLSTGRTTGIWGSSHWDDFPHTVCADLLLTTECTISFEGTNTLTKMWLQNKRYRDLAEGTIDLDNYDGVTNPFTGEEFELPEWERVGIIVADFPGRGLIEEIIKLNDVAIPPVVSSNTVVVREGTTQTFEIDGRGFNDERRLAMYEVSSTSDVPRFDDVDPFGQPRVEIALVNGEIVIRIVDLVGPDLLAQQVVRKTESQLVDAAGITVAEFKDRYVIGRVPGQGVDPKDFWWVEFSDREQIEIGELAAALARYTFNIDETGLQYSWHIGPTAPGCNSPEMSAWSTQTTFTESFPDDVEDEGRPYLLTVCARDSEKVTRRVFTDLVVNVRPTGEFADALVGPDGEVSLSGPVVDPGADDVTVEIDWGDKSEPSRVELGRDRSLADTGHVYTDVAAGIAPDSYVARVMLSDDDGGRSTSLVTFYVQGDAPFVTIERDADGDLEIDDPADFVLTGLVGGGACAPSSTITFDIDWGDGTSDEGLQVTLGADGRYSVPHTYPPNGERPVVDYRIEVTVTCDGDEASTTALAVSEIEPPRISQLAPVVAIENTLTEVGVLLSDISLDDGVVIDVDWGDGGPIERFDGDGSGGEVFERVSGGVAARLPHTYADDDPTATQADEYPIAVTVTNDTDGGIATARTTARVNNTAPWPTVSVTSNPDGTVQISGLIGDIAPLDTHSVVINWGAPGGVTTLDDVDAEDYEAEFRYPRSGRYTLTVAVTDDDGGTGAVSTEVTVVREAPTITTITGDTIDEGSEATVAVEFTDPTVDDEFTMSVDWGDGSTTPSEDYPAGTTSLSLTHLYADDPPGLTDDYDVEVTITDLDGYDDTATTTVQVRNLPPELASVEGSTVTEGGEATVSGTFSDPGTDAITVSMDWGGDVGRLEYDYPATATEFTESAPFADDAAIDVTVVLTDDDGASSQPMNVDVVVENAPPTVTAVGDTIAEGEEATVSGTISDPGTLDTHTIEIDWGDGTVEPPSDVSTGTWSETHVYDEVGTYTVTVTVRDDDGGIASMTATVEVANVGPTIIDVRPAQIDEHGTATIEGSFSDPTEGDTFTVEIDWGYGTVLDYAYPAGSTEFSESRQYLDDDPTGTPSDDLDVTVTVTDSYGESDSAATVVTVDNVDPAITATGTRVDEGDLTTVSGSVTDPGTLDTFVVELDWADGSTPTTVSLAAGAIEYSATHRYADDGSFEVAVGVTDDDTGTGTSSTIVVVDNVAPTIGVVVGDQIDENETATVSGEFSDPGVLDTFTVTVDWGDGTVLDYAYPAGSTTFSETHQYLDDDPTGTPSDDYAVVVTVEDDDGGVDTADTTVRVDNVAPVVSTPTPTFTSQYSDPFVGTALFAASDVAGDDTTPELLTAVATLDGRPLPPGLSLTAIGCSLGDTSSMLPAPRQTCIWTVSSTGDALALDVGSYELALTVTDDDGGVTTTAVDLVVAPEDARVDYTGPLFAATASAGDGTATVELRTTIRDISAVTGDPDTDPWPGDITTATVTFVDRSSGAPLCEADVELIFGGNQQIGTAACEWEASIGNANGEEFVVGTIVGGNYTRNESADDVVVTVARPLRGFIAGGGYLVEGDGTSSAGVYASDDGEKSNFGFNVKFNKKGTKLQGRATVIVRSGERVYQIKTNRLDSLGIYGDGPTQAEFEARANLTDVTDPDSPISIAGNLRLQMRMTDVGTPADTDLIGWTLYDSDGTLLHSSNWVDTDTEQAEATGNLVVHR